MIAAFKAVKITDRVYWVGAIDWALRDFHGYATARGTTYNAFLVLADKVTLVDTVKAPLRREMMARIASVIAPTMIDYIISNHSEMDHTGCLPETIEAVQPQRVFASAQGVEALDAHFRLGARVEAVADGQVLDLGSMQMTFLETRMLHWPDSMVSYLAEEQVLFSQDAFGQHLATQALWADQVPRDVLQYEAAKYYANIVLPFSRMVTKTVERLKGLKLPLRIIAPDHGPLYRKDLSWIVERYAAWAAQGRSAKAVVVYDTMWQSDALMAKAVAEGLAEGGADPIRVHPMHGSHRSDVAADLLDAGALIVGSPTLNQQMFPTVADVLSYVQGLKPKGLVGAAFGSYGWSSGAVKRIEETLKAMAVDLVAEAVTVNYVPDDAALLKCRELGRAVAEANAAKRQSRSKVVT